MGSGAVAPAPAPSPGPLLGSMLRQSSHHLCSTQHVVPALNRAGPGWSRPCPPGPGPGCKDPKQAKPSWSSGWGSGRGQPTTPCCLSLSLHFYPVFCSVTILFSKGFPLSFPLATLPSLPSCFLPLSQTSSTGHCLQLEVVLEMGASFPYDPGLPCSKSSFTAPLCWTLFWRPAPPPAFP